MPVITLHFPIPSARPRVYYHALADAQTVVGTMCTRNFFHENGGEARAREARGEARARAARGEARAPAARGEARARTARGEARAHCYIAGTIIYTTYYD
jgi:hypothetical protein